MAEEEEKDDEEGDELESPILVTTFVPFLRNATCSHEISFTGPKCFPTIFNGVKGGRKKAKKKRI